MLEESIAAAYAALNERNIVPGIQMPEEKVVRMLDRAALSRVFSNLLNNAIKYSEGDLEITLRETGEIIFTNTAHGLNEVEVGKLFDRFLPLNLPGNLRGWTDDSQIFDRADGREYIG